MIIRVLILLLCALTCFSCNEKKSQKIVLEIDKNTDPFRLKGMRVTSLDSILQDNDKNADIVFLYNFYDCGSCIDSGFQLVKRIDKFYKRKSVPIISSMGSPTLYQLRNQYFEFVYSDTNDLIRKELKYVQTPIMIRVDSNRMILDYLFPNVSDKNEYAHFLSSCLAGMRTLYRNSCKAFLKGVSRWLHPSDTLKRLSFNNLNINCTSDIR